jgi:hypothetical protein
MSETKFLIDAATAARVRDWARARMDPDPNGLGPRGDQYRTTSLYFDTASRDVLHRRGSFGRSKYRVRRYDGADLAFLERKLRTSSLLQKRRTVVPLAEIARIGRLDAAWPGFWFDRRLALRRLRPVCQVSYSRIARVALLPAGPVRLTLDGDVRACASTSLEFDGVQGCPILGGRMVLELKYPLAFPTLFKELIQDFRPTPARASKYRAAARELDLAGDLRAAATATEAAGATYA